jgi:hypothetical protein
MQVGSPYGQMLSSFQQPQNAFKAGEANMLQQMLCNAAMMSGYPSMSQ